MYDWLDENEILRNGLFVAAALDMQPIHGLICLNNVACFSTVACFSVDGTRLQ